MFFVFCHTTSVNQTDWLKTKVDNKLLLIATIYIPAVILFIQFSKSYWFLSASPTLFSIY